MTPCRIAVGLAFLGAACAPGATSLIGKACDDAHPCPSELVCAEIGDGNGGVCVSAHCHGTDDCGAQHACVDGICWPRCDAGCPDGTGCQGEVCRPTSTAAGSTRLAVTAASGRGSSASYRIQLRVAPRWPTEGTSSSYRVTGQVTPGP